MEFLLKLHLFVALFWAVLPHIKNRIVSTVKLHTAKNRMNKVPRQSPGFMSLSMMSWCPTGLIFHAHKTSAYVDESVHVHSPTGLSEADLLVGGFKANLDTVVARIKIPAQEGNRFPVAHFIGNRFSDLFQLTLPYDINVQVKIRMASFWNEGSVR